MVSTPTAVAADLRVTSKTASPNPVLAGQDLTYVVTVLNAGPGAATNVVVTDTLASLVAAGSLQSAIPSQGTCTPSGVTAGTTINLSCNLGTLASGAGASVTIVVRPSIATTGNRSNTASVTSLDVGDTNRGNNSASVTSVVTAVADATVSKTATPSPVQAGTPLTYVVTARNNGPSTASNVVATDSLPANASFVALSGVTGTGASCTTPAAGAIGGTVTCTWPSITSGSQQTATFVVRPLTGATSVRNDVSITTSTVESNTGNNAGTITTAVNNAAVDVLVNKVDSVDPVALGQTTRYTITVANAGPSFATNVRMDDTFPQGGTPTATFSYQGNLALSPSGAGTCIEPAIGATSGTLQCTFPGIASGQAVVVAYDMRAESIAAGVSGTTFNTASVSANEPETQPGNNQAVHATTTRRTADLAVVKTGPPSFTPGVAFDWTIVVSNLGPNASTGAILSDVLPAGVALQAASAGCAFAAGTLTCTLGTLAAGASQTVTLTVLPSSPYTGASPLLNTAAVATVNEVDPVPGNNASTASSTPGPALTDLAISKSGPASVLPGGAITWQLVVANAGPSAANSATFSDTLPAGVSGVSASCGTPTGGASCGPVNVAGTNVSGAIPTLPAGGSVTITINATAPGSGPLVNDARVDPPAGATDPNPGNNTASTTTNVPQADLAIVKTASGPFTLGQVGATYTIVVSNAGGAPSSGTVSVTDVLPSGLTATAISGTGWTCVLGTLSCTRSDVLSSGASWPAITLTVDIALTAPASVVNTANVSGGGDANPANNQSSVTTPLAPVPDLAIVKTANGPFTLGQVGATYTIVVSNAGGAPSSGTVSVTDVLPSGLTATAISGTGWTCVLGTLTCTRSDVLSSGASWPAITLTVDIALTAPASVVNTANVSGGGDANPANNQSSVTTPLAPVPDLAIVKTANGPFTLGQVGATYTIVVSNAGGAPSSGTVSVTDVLPSGLTATAISGTGWTCVLGTLTCTRSDVLSSGASWPAITLTVDIALTAPSSVVNTANVSGGGDANPANNQSSVTTPLAPVPDLAIVKTANGPFTLGQVGATYTIVVSNVGSVPSSGTVSVTDVLPAGLTATTMAGTGWTCTLPTLTCTRSDALVAGASWPAIMLTVNIALTAPATLINVATVAGGGDTNPTNDSTSVATPTGPAARPVEIPALAPSTLAALALLLAAAGAIARRRARGR